MLTSKKNVTFMQKTLYVGTPKRHIYHQSLQSGEEEDALQQSIGFHYMKRKLKVKKR